MYEFNAGSFWWKHVITESQINIGRDFCRRLYDEQKNSEDESSGSEHFYLCQRWKNAREPMFLFNQTRNVGAQNSDGTVSALIADTTIIAENIRVALEQTKFRLIPWTQVCHPHFFLLNPQKNRRFL